MMIQDNKKIFGFNEEQYKIIITKYDPVEIRNSLIYIYLQINDIKDVINKDILETQKEVNLKLVNLIVNHVLQNKSFMDIKLLEYLFEKLYSEDVKIERGIVYTPNYIIKYILDEVITYDGSLCDPSCGSGGFLIEALKKYMKITDKSVIEIIENNIYGCDISISSVDNAKILLSLLAESHENSKKYIDFHIITDNSLVMDWNKAFPNILLKKGGFDFIVGNPPYVKLQNMDEEIRKQIFDKWSSVNSGNYNLYIPFLQLGSELINESGMLGYIIYSMYFKSKASKKLREYLQRKKLINKIIDFGELQIFKDRTTYTCLTFINKKEKDFFYYSYLSDISLINNLNYTKIFYSDLNPRKWRLLTKEDYININNIEKSGFKLDTLTNISTGIATLKDSLYIVDITNKDNNFYVKYYNDKIYEIEKEITTEIIKVSDFQNEDEFNNNVKRIIYPYVNFNDDVILMDENYLMKKYPNTYDYLKDIKPELLKRDKGKKTYKNWYAYGRNQGLGKFEEKILTPTFSNRPRFMLCKNKEVLFNNGYSIALKKRNTLYDYILDKSNYSLELICKILNSKIMDYYIKRTSYVIAGGYYCYQKQFIETFALPKLSNEDAIHLMQIKNNEKFNDMLFDIYDVKI